jgi:hypothetical protein
VRDDLVAAHDRAWQRLARPGTWLDGNQRVAVAREARAVDDCPLCQRRLQALSPYGVEGRHAAPDLLAPLVEVAHRVRSDPARLTRKWFDEVMASGISDGEYVETVGVIATVVSLDVFARGLGFEPAELPPAEPGEPSRRRPAGLTYGGAWLPWLAPEDAQGPEADLYQGSAGAHIRRSLSLVPDEVRGMFDLVAAQYLPGAAMRDFDTEYRAIDHAQIELLAGRVSALNQCLY